MNHVEYSVLEYALVEHLRTCKLAICQETLARLRAEQARLAQVEQSDPVPREAGQKPWP